MAELHHRTTDLEPSRVRHLPVVTHSLFTDASPMQHGAPTVLRFYYKNVAKLSSYLNDILTYPQGSPVPFHPRSEDSTAYRELVESSYVAWNDSRLPPSYAALPAMTDMHEVIDQAQERIFKSKQSRNIITSGYRLASRTGDRGKKGMVRSGITNTFINTIVTVLHGPPWELLLQRIGVDAMLHLLTETSVFVSLPNECLCQMTGDPIIHLTPDPQQLRHLQPDNEVKRKLQLEIDRSDAPHKKRKLNALLPESSVTKSSKKPDKGIRLTAADISLNRSRLFYARSIFLPHTNQIMVGLSLKHVLNRLEEHHKPTSPENHIYDPMKQQGKARHLSKYIFPRQYGLTSRFEKISHRDASMQDFADREVEIRAAGPCKTPKRLREILPLVEKLIWRHKKCGYKPLRDIACPSKVQQSEIQSLDNSVILEMMSEQSLPLRSQASVSFANTSAYSAGNSILPLGLTQAKAYAANKPRFVEFTCNYAEVYRYVVLVTKAVIPKSFWGSESNFKLILRRVKEFIACRRFETLTLHHILQGFSTSACSWLMPPGEAMKKQLRVSVSDSQKQRELLEEFMYWYFDSFVQTLLKTNFYITESSAFKNLVLYFRHDDWATLCAPLIEKLTQGTFDRISDSDAAEVLRQRKLGFSFVRLLPKETGVRPIVNLRRKSIKGPYQAQQSINQVLQAAFHILSYERKSQLSLSGVSVLGLDEIYSKLRAFKARLLKDFCDKMPNLYFVKVDVQACFDTIEQSKLIGILHTLISEDVYTIRKFGEVSFSAGRVRRRYTRDAIPEDEHTHFLQLASELASVLRQTIFVDQVKYSYAKKDEILHLLEEHISENIVKIGQHYYRQTVGIPQGSVLSALLCSFFYGDMEKHFGDFTDHPHNLLLRMVDDYLFVTPDIQAARAFLNMMNQGHPEYGCFISKEKTLTNFDYGAEISNFVDSSLQPNFLWCGYSINMRTLSVSADYSRYLGSGLASSLTVERGRRPGAIFSYKILQAAKARSHAIYIDPVLNTEDVIYINIYQNFLLTAMKMVAYLRHWHRDMKKNTKFIYSTIQKATIYCYSSIRSQLRKQVIKYDKIRSSVNKWAVLWLGNYAFRYVLNRCSGQFKALLKLLDYEVSRPRYRRFQRRFCSLIKESQEELSRIPK